ncbi:hypothetical protein [Novispirillum itersonii]|uniref:hypothetical protein n=1 Tax=Novispirillum itersonii TaxID=189 RepID=UPI0003752AB8|nr:hypothetical protein [Novispirillum itersonii]
MSGFFLTDLPPLWSTDARETDQLVLPFRLSCRWHQLTWFPVERTDDVFYGLTLRTIPEWRHFHLRELTARYGGHAVLTDPDHIPAPASEIAGLVHHALLDLSRFHPSDPPLP